MIKFWRGLILVLTKDWFQKEIDSEPNPGTKLALERIYLKYTEAPTKEKEHPQTTLKDFDRDKTYNSIVKFYMDKKGYTKEAANDMAQQVVNREIDRRKLK